MLKRRKFEYLADGLSDIGKGRPMPGVESRSMTFLVEKDGDVFACVVGAWPGRIVTVICGDDEQVVGRHFLIKFRQLAIKFFERFTIA